MKSFIAAAALLAGSATLAYAQDQAPEPMDQPAAEAEQPMQPEQPMAPMAPMGPSTVAPGNSAPERDARGIAVVSDPAMAPAGYNQPPRMVPAGMPAPTVAPPAMTSAGPLPPCTRTVTDRCTQTYEGGRRRR